MKSPNNKANLLNYVAASLSMSKIPEILLRSITCFLGGMMGDGGQTIILRNGSEVVDELSCKIHEETDRRIFAHLGHCLQTFRQTKPLSMPQIPILQFYFAIMFYPWKDCRKSGFR